MDKLTALELIASYREVCTEMAGLDNFEISDDLHARHDALEDELLERMK